MAREPEIRQQLRHSRTQGLFPRHQPIAQRYEFKWSRGVHPRGNWISPERLFLKAIIYSPAEKGAEHVFTNSRRSGPREKACRFARGEAPSPRSCTNRRFKDRKAAFPQEWRCGGHQGWSADCQRVGTWLGVRRTGRPLRSAPYGGREDPGAI